MDVFGLSVLKRLCQSRYGVQIYCLTVIFVALIARKIMRNDFFLLAYIFSNMIAIVDLMNCFWQKLAKQDAIIQNGDEEK